MIDTATEVATATTETGREDAAPASIVGAGAGAISMSCAETAAAAIEKTDTITTATLKTLEMVACAIADKESIDVKNRRQQ